MVTAYSKDGQFATAKQMLLATLKTLERTLGPTHGLTGAIAFKLGKICVMGGSASRLAEMAEASRYFRRAVDCAANSFGMGHPIALEAQKLLKAYEPYENISYDSNCVQQ
jgi:hypothetical protein